MKHYAKLSLFLTFVASVCLIVGIVTPYWLSKPGHYQGIWEYCFYLTHTAGERTCLTLEHRPDFDSTLGSWIQAVRILVIASAVTSLSSILLLIIYLLRNDGRNNFLRIRVIIIFSIVSALLGVTAITMYAVEKRIGHFGSDYIFGWSFILTAIGASVMAVTLLPYVLEIRKSRALGLYESI